MNTLKDKIDNYYNARTVLVKSLRRLNKKIRHSKKYDQKKKKLYSLLREIDRYLISFMKKDIYEKRQRK